MRPWLVMLWVELIVGLTHSVRDHAWLSMSVGLSVNLLLQFALISAIKKQKLRLAGDSQVKERT